MAASFQNSYIINANIQHLCALVRSRELAAAQKVSVTAERPTQTGVWYQLQHGVSFSSWGENISLNLTALSEQSTQVDIRSECSMPTQVFDWGKNRKIVEGIYGFLCANSYSYGAPQGYR